MVRWDGGHKDVTWHTTNVACLYQEGDDFSIWIAHDDASGAVSWRYINLEEPWRRTPIGFDSRDLWLDLWSEPDSEEWHWKDEDELVWLVERGRVTAAQALSVRESGERALARIRAGNGLLKPSWSTWRPDPAWRIPTAPPNWSEVEPSG